MFYRELTDLQYEEICEETLNSITEKFEELADSDAVGEDFDVNFSVCSRTSNIVLWLRGECARSI